MDEPTIVAFLGGSLDIAANEEVVSELDNCDSCRELMSVVVREWHLGRPPRLYDLDSGSMVGRYRIEGPLGAGAMGVVYRAFDPVVARHVALKLIHVDSFTDSNVVLREAQAMGQVNHPAVVRIYDAGVTDAHVYVAMELVDGETLRTSLADRSRSPRQWYALFARIAEGLATAHDAGIVHRDFKPENVLVGRDGSAQVTDFGLARVSAGPAESQLHALGTQAAGTPAYMAPEQLTGGRVDAKSDQYSFAVTFYEALTGSRPILATSVDALAIAMKRRDVIDWTNVAGGARVMLARALAYDPDARFQSMHDMARELRRLAAPRRWPWLVVVVASLGAGIGVLVAVRPNAAADPCAVAGAPADAAWTATQRADLQRTYAAANLPYAVHVGRTAGRTLDEYASTLRAGYVAACRATHVHHTQSSELLDRRAQCLDRGTTILAATAALLQNADANVILNTTGALARLVDVRACADTVTLADQVQVPADPALRDRVLSIRRQLAEAGNAMITTRYDAGIALASTATVAAREVGYRPLEAEALFVLGSLQYAVRSVESARGTLESAALAAVAGRSRLMEATIRERLGQVLGLTLRDLEAGQRQIDLSLALLETMQGTKSITIQLYSTQGAMMSARGDHEGALALHRRSLALLSDDDRTLEAQVEQLIGDELVDLSRATEAIPFLERSASVARELVGEEHPTFAGLLESTADAYQDSDLPKSIELMTQAHAIYVKVLSAESSKFAVHEANLGGLLVKAGRVDEALPYLRRALATVRRTMAAQHPAQAMLLLLLGEALQKQLQLDEALLHTERAETMLVGLLGSEHRDVAKARAQRGALLGAVKRPDEATPFLELALATYRAERMPPDETAQVQFDLAKVLWDPARHGARNRSRVIELLDQAEQGLGRGGGAVAAWRRERDL